MFDRQKANERRTIVQGKAVELSKTHSFLLLQWATGTGKGKACMQVIDGDNSGEKWLVVVPEILQIENLIQDLKKHGFEHLLESKIEAIICYASFPDYEGWTGNLWFNEVHKLSKLKSDIAKTVVYKKVLADSATVPRIVRERLTQLGDFHTYTITLQEAIDKGILPEPSIHVIYSTVDENIKRNEVKRGKYKIKLTDREYIVDLENKLDWLRNKADELYQDHKDNKWVFLKMNQIGNVRKKFLASTKTNTLQDLIKTLGNKRFICFTGSLDQCNEVGGVCAIHSKKTKKHNLSTLQAFNEGEIEHIYVQKMGREGLNLEGIEAVIIVQLGSGKDDGLEFIQIAGRGFRADYPEMYIIVADGTADERNLRNALSNIDSKYIFYGQQEKQTAKRVIKTTGVTGKKRSNY